MVEGSRILREHGITLGRLQGSGGPSRRAQAEIANCVLVYRNTKLAAVDEPKQSSTASAPARSEPRIRFVGGLSIAR